MICYLQIFIFAFKINRIDSIRVVKIYENIRSKLKKGHRKEKKDN